MGRSLRERVQVVVEIGSDKARKELNDLENEATEIRDRMKDLKKGTKEYVAESTKLAQVESKMGKLRKTMGLAAMPLKTLRYESKKLNRELNQLTPGTDAFIKKSKDLKKVDDRIKEVRGGMQGVQKGMGMAGLATKGFKIAAQQAVMAFLPLFAFSKIIELGQRLLGIEDKITKLNGAVQRYSGLQGQALSEASAQVQALSDTFKVETDKINEATNAMSKQMGIGYVDALELVEKGLIINIGKGDEFLEQVKEYSTQFKAAGASGEQMITIISQSLKEGVFSDKGADTVKEFGLRIREQTKATSEAMEAAFGKKFTQDIFSGINDGSLTTVDALKRVATKLDDTQIPANKLQTVIADVFGGPGEDAGIEFIKSLKDVDGNLNNLIDTENVHQAQMIDRLSLNEQFALTEQELGIALSGSNSIVNEATTKFGILWRTVVLKVIHAFEYARETTENWKAGLYGLVGAAKESIKPLTDIGKGVYELVTGNFEAAKNSFQSALIDIVKSPVIRFDEIGQAYANEFDKHLGPEALKKRQERLKEQEDAFNQQQQAANSEHLKQMSAQEAQAAARIKAERERVAKNKLALDRSIADLKIELIDDEYEREKEKITVNAQRKIEDLKGTEQQITEQKKLLVQLRDQELQALEDEQREKNKQRREEQEEEDRQERWETYEEWEELERLRIEEKFLAGLQNEEEYNRSLQELQIAAAEERLNLLALERKSQTAEAQAVKNEILRIRKEQADEEVQIAKWRKETKEFLASEEFNNILSTTNALSSLLDSVSQEQAEKGRKNKTLSRAVILMQSGVEIARIWANAASMGPYGAIIGGLLTAAALVRTRQNLSKLDAVNVPSMAFGGLLPGPSHAQGGMPIVNPLTGQVVAEVEGGEPLLSKATYVHNKPIVDALLHSSQNRGGASIMEDGGTIPSPGTATASGALATAAAPQPTLAESPEALAILEAVYGQLLLLNQNFPTEVTGKWVYNDFKKLQDRIDSDDSFGSI